MDNLKIATPTQKNNTQRDRNGKIELLRFLFCISIVLYHSKLVMNDGVSRIMFSGRLGVEFFFLVSGYLMAVSAEKALQRTSSFHIIYESEQFIYRKFKSLYPMVPIAVTINVVLPGILNGRTLHTILNSMINRLPCLFLIQQTGIKVDTVLGLWYLSSMLLAMAILYPLLLRYHNYMRRIGCILIGVIALGYLMQTTNNIGVSSKISFRMIWNYNLRAIAILCFGIFTRELSKYLYSIAFNRNGRIVLALTEFILYFITFIYMMFIKGSKYDFFMIFVLLGAVTISFSEVAAFSSFFNNKFCYSLGKISLYVYLAHPAVAIDFTPLLGIDSSNKIRLIVYCILSAFSTIILFFVSHTFSRYLPKIKKLLID